MAGITLSIGTYSVIIQNRFVDTKYPRRHSDPSSSFQEDNSYSPRNLWEFSCLLKPEEATQLHQVYKEFLARYQAQTDARVSVFDTTGIVFEAQTNFFSWFAKPPIYTEEGAWVKGEISLREYSAPDGLLNGALSLSIGGAGVTLLQRFMEEKFPRTFAEESIPKVTYSILGATIITGPSFVGKFLWNVVYNATQTELNAIQAIRAAYNALASSRQSCIIGVSDSTMGGTINADALMTQFPQVSYNKESKDRIYRVQFGMQQA